jgi:TrmH family RNA methyltransferase
MMAGMSIPVFLTQLRVSGIKFYAATSKASAGFKRGSKAISPDLTQPCAIFIGNEGAGLPPEVERAAAALISVPTDTVESLNAAVAASIVLYEAARQRKKESQD